MLKKPSKLLHAMDALEMTIYCLEVNVAVNTKYGNEISLPMT